MAAACRWLLGWLATESEGARRCSNTKTTRPSKGNIYKSSQYNLAEEEEEEKRVLSWFSSRIYKRLSLIHI